MFFLLCIVRFLQVYVLFYLRVQKFVLNRENTFKSFVDTEPTAES